MTTLVDGTPVSDPRLGRVVQFDERSRNFQIAPVLEAEELYKPRGYTWSCDYWLDQGSRGRCVGYAFAAEIGARPLVQSVTNATGDSIFDRAQELDPWPGKWPEYDGTSVLAGAQSCVEKGHFNEYRWVGAGSGQALQDLILAVGYKGPVVLGLNWYTGMMSPDTNGFIHPTGQVEGGHAILCRSVSITGKRFGLHQSWGNRSLWWISFDDMGRLLEEQGEGCVPMLREKV
jgi:hypothetical protein